MSWSLLTFAGACSSDVADFEADEGLIAGLSSGDASPLCFLEVEGSSISVACDIPSLTFAFLRVTFKRESYGLRGCKVYNGNVLDS